MFLEIFLHIIFDEIKVGSCTVQRSENTFHGLSLHLLIEFDMQSVQIQINQGEALRRKRMSSLFFR